MEYFLQVLKQKNRKLAFLTAKDNKQKQTQLLCASLLQWEHLRKELCFVKILEISLLFCKKKKNWNGNTAY